MVMKVIYQKDFSADPNLMPQPGRHPYYIVTPRYVRVSAGVRCLHLLCHYLNSIGQSAFILSYSEGSALNVNPELVTPELNDHIVDYHFRKGLTPITLYPEIISGNPFNAPVRVRFLGNFPGLLGGDKTYAVDEICFGYSKVLADAVGSPENILFIPVIDTRTFKLMPQVPRSGTCFYASKYQEAHRRKVFGLPSGCIEITRDKEDSPTSIQIAELFRKSELFYCFENSSLAVEAALCGCPTVLMYNEFFSVPIALEELGWDGFARGNDSREIERARQTVGNVLHNYRKNIDKFWDQLEHFVKVTQSRAMVTEYKERMNVDVSNMNVDVPNLLPVFRISMSSSLLGLKFLWRLQLMRDKGLMKHFFSIV